jgi:glycosyltransferase involved in cell wall biosynthesis
VRVRLIAGPYGKVWFGAMLLTSTRVILTNEQDEWRFLRQRPRYPVPASRFATIPVGSNLPPVAVPEVRSNARELTVGYFGFVNPAKGVDTLLDGFALAYRRCPVLRLEMVCTLQPQDPYHQTLLRRLEAAPLRDVVTVTGELNDGDAAAALARCDMAVLPFRDGVSLRRTTLVAALALGRPVISTRAAVPPAALQDGRDVVLVPPGDAEALAQAIVDLAGDPARRAALGAHASEASRAFAWPAIAARTEDLYRQALE